MLSFPWAKLHNLKELDLAHASKSSLQQQDNTHATDSSVCAYLCTPSLPKCSRTEELTQVGMTIFGSILLQRMKLCHAASLNAVEPKLKTTSLTTLQRSANLKMHSWTKEHEDAPLTKKSEAKAVFDQLCIFKNGVLCEIFLEKYRFSLFF